MVLFNNTVAKPFRNALFALNYELPGVIRYTGFVFEDKTGPYGANPHLTFTGEVFLYDVFGIIQLKTL